MPWFCGAGVCEKVTRPTWVVSRSKPFFCSSGSRYMGGLAHSGPLLWGNTCKTISMSRGLVLTVARLCIKGHNHYWKGGNTPVASGQWPAARCFMITPQAGPANQMWSSAGSCSFGHHCSKHFPLDVGFLLCLAATLGCLNFSQRQIFIHQSVQCSTGQAWEGEGETSVPFRQRGCVLFFFFSFPFPLCAMVMKWDHPGGPLSSGCMWFFAKRIQAANLGCAFKKKGFLSFLPAPLIPLGKFTVNIFPGTLSSFWQSLSVCRTVKLSRGSKLWEICFYSNP